MPKEKLRVKKLQVVVVLDVPESLSREQISDEVKSVLKKYNPFIEDVDVV